MDNQHVRNMKIVLLVSSVASFLILGGAALRENFLGEWRVHQKEYRRLLTETAHDDRARASAASFAIEHKQLYLPELKSIDRCTTCHLGVENPNMIDAEQPLKKHSGDLLSHHPSDLFGCTVCHEGQGRAVDKHAAHGWHDDGSMVKHAETPRLRGKAIYTSCGKCHYETDLYGGIADLHSTSMDDSPDSKVTYAIDEAALSLSLPSADIILGGKRLLVSSGCLGCHTYRGRGGSLGPDITYVGEKTRHDFDFTHIQGEHTVEQWLYEHFMFPKEISPDTIMPDMGYSEEQAAQLTSYMMSLHRKSAPVSHRPPPPLASSDAITPVRGETLFAMFCSACHGKEGYGSTLRAGLWPVDADPWGHQWDSRTIVTEQRSDLDVLVPSLNHADTLAVASREYLRQVISTGRPGTKMIGWTAEGGLTADEITLLVDYILTWNPPGPNTDEIAAARGDARIGGALYRGNCASCHGVAGEGGIGVSLNSPTFLAVASDAFLTGTIVHGRPNTAMPAWREFSSQEVSDLLAFIRQWQEPRGTVKESLTMMHGNNPDVRTSIGKTLFKANCAICHGSEGQGDLGPSLNTQEFLTVVGDDYLATTLINGRPETAMPAWRHLSNEDIASLLRYIRTWQRQESKPPSWHAELAQRGDSDAGGMLFTAMCSSCHGVDGEGTSGPQLNNPEFLEVASDRMLREWIRNGKFGTEMRAFRKGGQGIAELSDRQIEDIVAHLRSLQYRGAEEITRVGKSPNGRPEKGADLFVSNCSGCHGTRGEGSSGPALSNRNFLRFASDGFLLATMALGRHGTEMRPVKRGPQSILGLTSDEVNDLVAYLRSWEYDSPYATAQGYEIPHRFVVPWDQTEGKRLFEGNCVGCHGSEGKGSWAPELNNEGFLAAATDGFLQATIIRGRKGTAMRPFGMGSHGITDLTSDDVDNIVSYIRSWSKLTPSPMTIPAERSVELDQTHRAVSFSSRGFTDGENVPPLERPRELKLTARGDILLYQQFRDRKEIER